MLVTLLSIVAIVTLMIGLNALYVAGEFAAVGARKTRVRQMADQGNRLAQTLLPILEDTHRLDRYIAASQVGITLSSLILGIYGQNAIAPRLEPLLARLSFIPSEAAAAGISATLVLIVLTVLQVVLGELVPKSIAVQYPERVAMATALPMRWSAEIVLRPLIAVLNGSGALLLRLLGVSYSGEHAHIHSPEEIEILVSESARGGLLDAEERQLLHNAFRLGALTAGEIMVPRTRLVAAPVEESLEAVLRLAAESAYTRLPLFEGDLDHIVGFVHLRELFRLHQERRPVLLREILRELPFVPETMPAVEVWELLNREQCYLAIVFDEYGGTAGLITQEDLIEELFGELQDEFDQESALIVPKGDGQFVVRGDLLVSTLNELLGTRLDTEIANTVAGLVLDELGRVPQVGDEVTLGALHARVEAVAGRTVREVSLLLPPELEEALEDAERP